jgi:hypothetical protein
MIYLFSSARSGSTWLGKIFDSHPDVLYLHEPEIADRGMDLLPFWFQAAPTATEIEKARLYLDRMIRARTPRATGTRPFFRKSYRSAFPEQVRRALVYMAKGSERIGLAAYSNRLTIPDLADRGKPGTCVIKSVSALGRAEAIIKAAGPAIRPALLLRHPCGYVNSMLRGDKIGVMKPIPPLGTLLETRAAKRLGATPSVIAAADDVEKLAWNWLLANAEAYPAIAGAGGAVIVYENFADDALGGAKTLFAQLGLGWASETEIFLRRSAESEGGYYSVFRDPEKAANRWRAEISEATMARVRAIVTRDPLGQSFFPD